MAQKKQNAKIKKFLLGLAVLAVLTVVGLATGELTPEELMGETTTNADIAAVADSDFAVHFVDVGQGDCILIESGGKTMLIDAGENGNEEAVFAYLKQQKVESFDYIVATHPHSDHIGGMYEVMSDYPVKNVIMPRLSKNNTPTTVTYEKMLKAAKASDAKVIAAVPGNIYSLGGAEFQILAPFKQDENMNNMSVAVKLTYQGRSFLFTGDAETDVEEQMLGSEYDLSADVFKLGHHGSTTSNSEEFLRAVNPDYAVICCGEDNSYGHPHREIMDLVYDMELSVYRTDKDGSVVFTVENNEIKVAAEK